MKFNAVRVRGLVSQIEARLDLQEPAEIFNLLEREVGIRPRFADGTYHLRMAGVHSTCTAGGHGLLRNWCNAARRRLEERVA